MPVMISRCGRWPWRTTRCWPVSVFRSACFARNSATSASTAWVSSARAPLRRISVRESVKAPGWASLITLPSDTAYHSFIGEVEALNTTTIRRLTPSCRHQLLAIAPATGSMTTGTVSHAQTLKGWFVLMKDSKNGHPGNKLWGNGWGWSWFDAANPSKTTSTDYKANCLPCHEPARATDWIYVQGYPALKQ